MLAIKVNNEFLDLPADISMEMDRNSPFLGDDTDSINGQFSLGLTIGYSEKNYRLLTFLGNFYKGNAKFTVDAEVYDNNLFRYAGQLLITAHQTNMNRIEQTVWTATFTIGSASFLQSIQDVALNTIDFGGVRTFPWTTFDPTDGSGGFWQHYHAARVPNSFPYTFYTIQNDGWGYHATWMNKIGTDGNFDPSTGSISPGDGNTITATPAIYLDFILRSIFKNYGWSLSGEVTSDIGYQKITIPSFKAIEWSTYFPFDAPFSSVSFDLKDFVPQDVTIGAFLIDIKNRMGWWFDFDSNTKTVYLRGYQSIIASGAKDWTKYVQSNYSADYSNDPAIYSLVNNIDPQDDYPIVMDIDPSTVLEVNARTDLPAATAANAGQIGYVFQDDVYYKVEWVVSSSIWFWVFYSHNIGSYLPPGNNNSFESDISTMPMALYALDSRNVLVPICNQPGNYYNVLTPVSWGIRFLFYHGMFPDSVGVNYPFASSINQAISGTPTGSWVLPFKHEYGSISDGTYDYWWKNWLNILKIQDIRTITFSLPVTELKKFSFGDIIFVNNVFFMAISAKEMLPYQGLIEMKLQRMY